MGSIGTPEILLIFLVVLLVFGAKRIPEIARGLGKGIREFKDATREISNEMKVDDSSSRVHTTRPPAQAPTPRNEPATQSQQAQEPAPTPTQASNPASSDPEKS